MPGRLQLLQITRAYHGVGIRSQLCATIQYRFPKPLKGCRVCMSRYLVVDCEVKRSVVASTSHLFWDLQSFWIALQLFMPFHKGTSRSIATSCDQPSWYDYRKRQPLGCLSPRNQKSYLVLPVATWRSPMPVLMKNSARIIGGPMNIQRMNLNQQVVCAIRDGLGSPVRVLLTQQYWKLL